MNRDEFMDMARNNPAEACGKLFDDLNGLGDIVAAIEPESEADATDAAVAGL